MAVTTIKIIDKDHLIAIINGNYILDWTIIKQNNAISMVVKAGSVASSTPSRKRRPISDQWKPILRFIGGDGGVSMSELGQFAWDNHAVESKLLRSQIRYYTKQGLMKQSEDKYHLTELGKSACGL